MNGTLVNLGGLATELGLPRAWLKDEAEADRIPYLRVGRRLRFDFEAVRSDELDAVLAYVKELNQ